MFEMKFIHNHVFLLISQLVKIQLMFECYLQNEKLIHHNYWD